MHWTRRIVMDRELTPPGVPYWAKWKASSLRKRYLDEVDDPALRPKPLPPRPSRRDKRRPSKPR